jgi:hypothetical protein
MKTPKEEHQSTGRAAYSPAEFAASCGRHPSWAYSLLYGGKVKALTDLGGILPRSSQKHALEDLRHALCRFFVA